MVFRNQLIFVNNNMLLVRKQISLLVNIYDDDFQHCLDHAVLFQLLHLLLRHNISHRGEDFSAVWSRAGGWQPAEQLSRVLLEEHSHQFGISGPLGPKHLKYSLLVE